MLTNFFPVCAMSTSSVSPMMTSSSLMSDAAPSDFITTSEPTPDSSWDSSRLISSLILSSSAKSDSALAVAALNMPNTWALLANSSVLATAKILAACGDTSKEEEKGEARPESAETSLDEEEDLADEGVSSVESPLDLSGILSMVVIPIFTLSCRANSSNFRANIFSAAR